MGLNGHDDRSAEDRSRAMRAVKSKDTRPELALRSLVHRMGYRYRLHRKDLPGTPDLVFPSKRKVIFLHGCFWHGHTCKRGARIPKSNREYWLHKIKKNKARDETNITKLIEAGWKVLIVWECELRELEDLKNRIRTFLDN